MPADQFVLSISFSPDGKFILSGERDAKLCLHEVASGKKVWQAAGTADVWAVEYSYDGHTVASGDGKGQVAIWDAATARQLQVMQADSDCRSVVYSPNSQKVATGDKGSNVMVWQASTGRQQMALKAGGGFIRGLAWSPNGRLIAAGDETSVCLIWNASTGMPLKQLQCANWVMSVAFTSDSNTLGLGDKTNTVTVWDVPSGSHALTAIRAFPPLSHRAFALPGRPEAARGRRERLGALARDLPARQYDLQRGQERSDHADLAANREPGPAARRGIAHGHLERVLLGCPLRDEPLGAHPRRRGRRQARRRLGPHAGGLSGPARADRVLHHEDRRAGPLCARQGP